MSTTAGRRCAAALVTAAFVAAGLAAAACGRRASSCDDLVAARAWQEAAATCLAAYRQGGDAASGAAAARSLLRSGRADEAEAVARELRGGPRGGDALLVLGDIAVRGDPSAALALYQDALAALQRAHDDAGASRAAHAIGGLWLARGEFVRAMQASQLAVESATRAGDVAMQLYATLGRSDLLRRQGLLLAAEQDLASAAGLARTPRDQAWVALKHGSLYIERELDALAHAQLERALALAPAGSEVVLAARIDLAWLERRAGNLARSAEHIAAAAAIAPEDVDVRVNRALLLADQGQLDAATSELEVAARSKGSAERAWWIAYNQGLLAARRDDIDGQLTAYRRAIDAVRAMSSRAGANTPDVAASHRQPFLRLIGVHARRGDWPAALGLVMELDSLALLATERTPAPLPGDPATGPPVAAAAPPALPAISDVLAAWRGRRLAILVSDEQTVWRIELADGRATGLAVGREADLATHARTLEADPSASAAATALGAAIVPPAAPAQHATATAPSGSATAADRAAPVTPVELYVLLIGAIARTPLAALRMGGQPIVGRAALARVLGVLPRAPGSRPASPSPGAVEIVVLGDPRGDLPSARAEAAAVAATLGVPPRLGNAATAAALSEARGARLLHVAAHSATDGDGPSLVLADRAVRRADILAAGGAPAVVVLASCGGAVARDDAGWGSLAAAYLAAGADAVLAASWTIDDAATSEFIAELYRHPVRDQPARALSAAQSIASASVPARVWAGFTVIAAPPSLSR